MGGGPPGVGIGGAGGTLLGVALGAAANSIMQGPNAPDTPMNLEGTEVQKHPQRFTMTRTAGPTPQASPAGGGEYALNRGDTISQVAAALLGPGASQDAIMALVQRISEASGLAGADPTKLAIGTKLALPEGMAAPSAGAVSGAASRWRRSAPAPMAMSGPIMGEGSIQDRRGRY